MSTLSIFVDESGDFGWYDPNVPFYIVSLALHDQSFDIRPQMQEFDRSLVSKNLRVDSIHTRPLLRHEPPYNALTLHQQRYLLNRLYLFALKCNLAFKMFTFDRRQCRSPEELERIIARQIGSFAIEAHDWLSSFSRVVLYYDDGQKRLSGILSKTFGEVLPNLERRHIDPVDYQQYRLAQVADLACCLELTERRFAAKEPTRSDELVFGSRRDFEKSLYKKFKKRQL